MNCCECLSKSIRWEPTDGCIVVPYVGNYTTDILSPMVETEAYILEMDHKVDIGTASEIVGYRACLMGSLNGYE